MDKTVPVARFNTIGLALFASFAATCAQINVDRTQNTRHHISARSDKTTDKADQRTTGDRLDDLLQSLPGIDRDFSYSFSHRQLLLLGKTRENQIENRL